MTDREKFDKMLALDAEVYKNLVKAKALIAERRKPITDYKSGKKDAFQSHSQFVSYTEEFNGFVRAFNEKLKRYTDRQNDYRTNQVYNIGKSIEEFNDRTISYFKGLWNNVIESAGLGALPALVVPVSVAASATIVGVALIYFLNSYFDPTVVDYEDSLKLINELAKTDPVLATAALDKLNQIQQQQNKSRNESNFFTQVAKGIKTSLVLGMIGLVANEGFKTYKSKK